MKDKRKIAVAITGASGAIYAYHILRKLTEIKTQVDKVAVVISENAKTNWQIELGNQSFTDFDFDFYNTNDFESPIASGSANYDTLIIAPCSAGTMGRIANGISNDLTTRAADVILKERRKLILLLRETPYNLIHINNMEKITLAGGIICPASPSFYSQPKTIDELVMTVTDRVFDLAGFDIKTFRWNDL